MEEVNIDIGKAEALEVGAGEAKEMEVLDEAEVLEHKEVLGDAEILEEEKRAWKKRYVKQRIFQVWFDNPASLAIKYKVNNYQNAKYRVKKNTKMLSTG